MIPVDKERCAAATKAVKGQVEALLKKFLAVDPIPSAGGTAEPATQVGGAGEGDVATVGASLASDDDVQG